jgi:hypothetical protein
MRRLLGVILFGGLLAGCAAPAPLLLSGDAQTIEFGYATDPSVTLRPARLHCAAYERVPRLLQAQNNVAYYACVRPAPGAVPAAGS